MNIGKKSTRTLANELARQYKIFGMSVQRRRTMAVEVALLLDAVVERERAKWPPPSGRPSDRKRT